MNMNMDNKNIQNYNNYSNFSESNLRNEIATRISFIKNYGLLGMDINDFLSKKFVIYNFDDNYPESKFFCQNLSVVALHSVNFSNNSKVFNKNTVNNDGLIKILKNSNDIFVIDLSNYDEIKKAFLHNLAITFGCTVVGPLEALFALDQKELKFQPHLGNARYFHYGIKHYYKTLENIDFLMNMCDKLHDSFSKNSFLNMILYKLSFDYYYLNRASVGHNYGSFYNAYPVGREYLNFNNEEVYVDAGTFDGHTVEIFLQHVSGKFKKIYTFEPSAESNMSISKKIEELNYYYVDNIHEKIIQVPKGLWSKETVLKYNPSLDMSMNNVRSVSGHFVDVSMLDNMVAEETDASIDIDVTTVDQSTDLDATFIKFEIEGSELQALEGAKETIKKNKPKIALSIYHLPNDYCDLFKKMESFGMDYKYGFRQHGQTTMDATVLYCF